MPPEIDPVNDLPHWASHKVVRGDRIVSVSEGGGDVLFRWHLKSGHVIDVKEDLAGRVRRGSLATDGYYVLYENGYESWSPADAFEGGYTRLAPEA